MLREGQSFEAVIRMNGRGKVEKYKQWESVGGKEGERYMFRYYRKIEKGE